MSPAKRSTGKSAARPAPKKPARRATKKTPTPARKKSALAGASNASAKKAKKAARAKPPVANKIAKRAGAPPSRPSPPRRADLGAPIDGFFEKQPPHILPILEELRAIVIDVVPEATSSIKWGMPFFVIGSETVCALAGFKSHVNLILPGPPGTFDDPEGRLEGEGKTGRHLKLRSLEELPRDSVRGWIATAARFAREGAKG